MTRLAHILLYKNGALFSNIGAKLVTLNLSPHFLLSFFPLFCCLYLQKNRDHLFLRASSSLCQNVDHVDLRAQGLLGAGQVQHEGRQAAYKDVQGPGTNTTVL